MSAHHPYAVGHTFLARRAAINLGLPEGLLPPGDMVGLVTCRDAVTGEPCTHFGKADDLRAVLLLASAFGVSGTVSEDGTWVGDPLAGFSLCAKGHPVDWVRRLANT